MPGWPKLRASWARQSAAMGAPPNWLELQAIARIWLIPFGTSLTSPARQAIPSAPWSRQRRLCRHIRTARVLRSIWRMRFAFMPWPSERRAVLARGRGLSVRIFEHADEPRRRSARMPAPAPHKPRSPAQRRERPRGKRRRSASGRRNGRDWSRRPGQAGTARRAGFRKGAGQPWSAARSRPRDLHTRTSRGSSGQKLTLNPTSHSRPIASRLSEASTDWIMPMPFASAW